MAGGGSGARTLLALQSGRHHPSGLLLNSALNLWKEIDSDRLPMASCQRRSECRSDQPKADGRESQLCGGLPSLFRSGAICEKMNQA